MCMMTEMLPVLNLKFTSDNPFILTAKPAVTKAVKQQKKTKNTFIQFLSLNTETESLLCLYNV